MTGLAMVGSTTYALAHPKNANAPLQPPVAERAEPTVEPDPDPTTAPPFRTLAPTLPPTPSPSPTPTPTPRPAGVGTVARPAATPDPQITLAAGVRATALPRITITHSS